MGHGFGAQKSNAFLESTLSAPYHLRRCIRNKSMLSFSGPLHFLHLEVISALPEITRLFRQRQQDEGMISPLIMHFFKVATRLLPMYMPPPRLHIWTKSYPVCLLLESIMEVTLDLCILLRMSLFSHNRINTSPISIRDKNNTQRK